MVTPVSKQGYLIYRLTSAVTVSFLLTPLLVFVTGLTVIPLWKLVLLSVLGSLQAPLMSLFLISFASNKVEGLALAKGVTIVEAGPFMGLLLPAPWHLTGGLFPPFWITQAFRAAHSGSGSYGWYLAGGAAISLLYLYLLFRRFVNVIE